MTIITRIEELAAEGNSTTLIRAFLTIEGYKGKEISEGIKESGLTAKKVTFASEFYDWLAEEKRTQEEAEEYILDESNSKNVHKHLSHYLNIADLAERIWS